LPSFASIVRRRDLQVLLLLVFSVRNRADTSPHHPPPLIFALRWGRCPLLLFFQETKIWQQAQ
jgi:hypothetical protein